MYLYLVCPMFKSVKLLFVIGFALQALNLSAGTNKPFPDNKDLNVVIKPVANFTSNKTVICVGDSIAFTDLSSNAPTSWNWTFTGGTPPNSVAQNPTITYNTPGTFTVKLVATNSAGTDSLTIVNYVTVNPLPVITVNPSAPSICKGDSVLLTASGATTYTWKPTTDLSCSWCTQTYAKPNTTTTFTVVGMNGSGCVDSTTVTVTVGAIIVTIQGSADTICQGNSDTLKAYGATSYLWNNSATTSSIIVNPSATTVYSVTGTSLTCQNNASFTVTVNPAPIITITGNDTICLGGSTNLTANGAVNYFWAPSSGLSCTACPSPAANPTVTTTYTIIGTDNNGCSNATTKTIYVIPKPTVKASHPPPVCAGVFVSLSANGSPAGGTYKWQPCNKTGQSIVDTPKVTTQYTVTYTTPCGSVTDTVTVFVNPIPNMELFVNFKSGCAQLCLLFRSLNTVPGASISSYSWDFGDGGTSNLQNPPYCYTTPGTYTVTLMVNSGSCSKTTNMATPIVVYARPKADFTYTPNPATILDPLVNFSDISSDTYPITTRLWNFGDKTDSASNSRYPSHLYSDTGVYCPYLVVTDVHGCQDTSQQCFDISTQYSFYIPSSFSPNGDGENEVFTAKGTDVTKFEMYIYDRWGLQLYHTNDINEGWNGKVKSSGRICQEDVYVYVINVTDKKQNQHHFTGAVYLVK